MTNTLCLSCGAERPGGTICATCTRTLTATLRRIPWLLRELDTDLARQAKHPRPQAVQARRTDLISSSEAATLTATTRLAFAAAAGALGHSPRDDWWTPDAVADTADRLGYGHLRDVILHPELTASAQPSPVDGAALAARAHLRDAVGKWTARLVTDTGQHPDSGDTTTVVAWLVVMVSAVRQRPWAAAAEAEISHAVTGALRVIDTAPPMSTVGPCPSCGADLTAGADVPAVTCGGCGAVVDVTDARDARLREAEDRELTARQVAAAMTTGTREVTSSMIRGWVARDAKRGDGLRPVRVSDRGQPLFRLGDVVDRWARSQARSVPGAVRDAV